MLSAGHTCGGRLLSHYLPTEPTHGHLGCVAAAALHRAASVHYTRGRRPVCGEASSAPHSAASPAPRPPHRTRRLPVGAARASPCTQDHGGCRRDIEAGPPPRRTAHRAAGAPRGGAPPPELPPRTNESRRQACGRIDGGLGRPHPSRFEHVLCLCFCRNVDAVPCVWRAPPPRTARALASPLPCEPRTPSTPHAHAGDTQR